MSYFNDAVVYYGALIVLILFNFLFVGVIILLAELRDKYEHNLDNGLVKPLVKSGNDVRGGGDGDKDH